MDRTDSRLAHSPEPASDDAASPFNSKARDRQDLLDFEPVPLRYRTGGLTPQKQREYVEALADTGVCREAAARVGVSEQAINRVRRRCDAFDFDRACEAAYLFGARRLRSIAFERAIEGTLKGRYYHGELVSQERVYDNRLLVYLLGKVEHLLEPTDDARAVADNWEPCMVALEQGLPSPDLASSDPEEGEFEPGGDPHCSCDEDGIWWTCFPPPEGYDGKEEGELGDPFYRRTLTAEEEAAAVAHEAEEDRAEIARCCDIRDRYFGLPPRGAAGFSIPRQAETPETPETSAPPPTARQSLSGDAQQPEGPCPSLPDQIRDDARLHDPSSRRRPEPETTEGRSMNTEVGDSLDPCSWIPDQVRDDGDPNHSRHPGECRGPGETRRDPPARDPGFRREDDPAPHIQTPPSRHPFY
jgi:hypothetical protein